MEAASLHKGVVDWLIKSSSSPSAVGVLIVPKEMYPYPPDIPEGRWAVYEVTLPNRPRFPVTVTYHTITDTIALSHPHMTFVPDVWNIPQDLTVYALEDAINTHSPYAAAFNLSLSSLDRNYNGPLPNFNVTVEDNDEGMNIGYTTRRQFIKSCAIVDNGGLQWLLKGIESGIHLVMYVCSACSAP